MNETSGAASEARDALVFQFFMKYCHALSCILTTSFLELARLQIAMETEGVQRNKADSGTEQPPVGA